MNTMIANPAKWFTHNDGAWDEEFIKKNEVLKSHGTVHTPVSSADILTKFRDRAKELNLVLKNEQCALLKQKMKMNKNTGCEELVGGDRYMYIAEVEDNSHPDYALSIGFRNFGDRTLAFSGMCSSTIFCCENGVCHGLFAPSKIRHTKGNMTKEGLLDSKIDAIFSRFKEDSGRIHEQIGTMKSVTLTDDIISKFLKRANGEWKQRDGKWVFTKNPYLGSANLLRILEDLENPERNDKNDSSVMRLMNSCSHITSHTISNPNQGLLASNFCNNLIMSIIKDDFVPLGDDVIDVSEGNED